MPDIVTRGTKSSELSFQEGDEQIAETQLAVTGALSIDENHNRQHLVITTGTGAISLDTASALNAALDITHTGAVKIGWIVKISNNSGSANTINLTTGTDTLNGVVGGSFSLADNDSVIISFDNVSATKGYNIVGEYIGTLPVARGGTGVATLADGGILLGSAAGAVTVMAQMAAGEIAVGTGGDPGALAAGATTEVLVGGGAANPVWTTATGSGSPVRATSPTLVTPALGTPASGTLTNCIGLPIAGGGTGATTAAAARTALGIGATWAYLEELTSTGATELGETTSIPSGCLGVKFVFDDVSVSGTNDININLGDSTAYSIQSDGLVIGVDTAAGSAGLTFSSGNFLVTVNSIAASIHSGIIEFIKLGSADDWVGSGTTTSGVNYSNTTGGHINLTTSELTRARVVSSGPNTFDSGSVFVYVLTP